MAFQPAPSTALLELLWGGQNGQTWQNNLHFTKANFVTADLTALAGIVATVWNASDLKPLVSNNVVLIKARATDLRTEGAPQVEASITQAGNNTDDYGDAISAVVVTLRTALRGRSYRGRSYITGIREESLNGGVYGGDAIAASEDFIDGLRGAATAIGWTMVVLSRFHNHVELAEAVPTPVTSVEVRVAEPGSQRRRSNRH